MERTKAPYIIQRKAADAREWSRVACCGSLAYAELIAAAGMRRNVAARYRAVQSRSGAKIALGPGRQAQAA